MARRVSIGGNREAISKALHGMVAEFEENGNARLPVKSNGGGQPNLVLEFTNEGDDPEFSELLVDYFEGD